MTPEDIRARHYTNNFGNCPTCSSASWTRLYPCDAALAADALEEAERNWALDVTRWHSDRADLAEAVALLKAELTEQRRDREERAVNAEDLNDICGRAARGAPIDADHVLEIIADLTAGRAELADVRAVLAAVDELGRGITIGLARAAEERDAALAAIARVRELCDDLHPFCKGGHVLDAVRDAATIERTKK